MNINNKIQWEDNIKLLTRLERVEGGRSGAANIQAEQLANRTLWLKAQLESVRDGRELTFY
ncbi:SGNH/GDSL hydrolase family protein, partial [Klebsiella pneumoniae]|nr:SGNH/GDSL hydrolase family protein [Klebsiella pneumoniae]